MLSHKEYKVLCMIKQIKDQESASAHTYKFIFKGEIDNKVNTLKIKDYELNEIMRSLNRQEYICNLFNTDTNAIYGTEITDSGLVAIKNYKKDFAKYIFKRYIWVLFTIVITAILTGYFTSFFTK